MLVTNLSSLTKFSDSTRDEILPKGASCISGTQSMIVVVISNIYYHTKQALLAEYVLASN